MISEKSTFADHYKRGVFAESSTESITKKTIRHKPIEGEKLSKTKKIIAKKHCTKATCVTQKKTSKKTGAREKRRWKERWREEGW